MKTIYCLKKGGIVFYVGATNSIRKRTSEHHIKWGYDVDLVVLEVVEDSVALTREVYWIKSFPSLANVAHTPATKLPKAHVAKRNFSKLR